MFTLDQLHAFCCTVEMSSYSQASRSLSKERTTIREHVKAIEDTYNLQLVTVSGKKILPTPVGEQIYYQAKLIIASAKLLNQSLLNTQPNTMSELTIYHELSTPIDLIAAIEKGLSKRYPLLKVHWLVGNRDFILNEVMNDNAKISILQNRLSNTPEYELSFVNLGSYKLNVYCHPDHPLTKNDVLNLSELRSHKQYILEEQQQNNRELYTVAYDVRKISSLTTALKLLESDGWAMLTDSQAEKAFNEGKLTQLNIKEVLSSIDVGYSLYYASATSQSEITDAIIDIINSSM